MANLFGSALRMLTLPSKPATPPAGELRVYAKSDNLLYRLGSDGIEQPVDTFGSGGGPGVSNTAARLVKSADQSIPTGVNTNVTFDQAAAWSTPPGFADVANNRLVIPVTGFYTVTAYGQWSGQAGVTGNSHRSIYLYVNGNLFRADREFSDANSVAIYNVVAIAGQFTAGDVITLACGQNTGTNSTIQGTSGSPNSPTTLEAVLSSGPAGPTGPTGPVSTGPAYRGEWATIDGQTIPSGTWTGRFGWQPGWNATGNAGTAPAVSGIKDSNNGSNPGEFIIVNAGFYQCNLNLALSSDTPSYSRQARLLLNGSVLATTGVQLSLNNNLSMGLGVSFYAPANSVLRVEGWQNSGANVAWNTNYDRNNISIFSLNQGPAGPAGPSGYTPNVVSDYNSTSTASIANTTWTTVAGWASTTGSNTYISGMSGGVATFIVPGMYVINATVTFAGGTASRRIIRLTKNGTEVRRFDTSVPTQQSTLYISHMMPMAINDTMTIDCYQQTGGALALANNPGHEWQVWKISDALNYG